MKPLPLGELEEEFDSPKIGSFDTDKDMNSHTHEFFKQFSDDVPSGNFHKVIALHEGPDMDWETLSELVPCICKGWYELSHLSPRDRIDFTRDYWLAKLPYKEGASEAIVRFFDSLDDVGIYLTQKRSDDPFQSCLVYSLKDNTGFYRGGSPANDEMIDELQQEFPDYLLPEDYKAFLKIHNGFWKTTDCTGIIGTKEMKALYDRFQIMAASLDRVLTFDGKEVNPKTLIPFYESFGLPFFQCFWAEWYPQNEMGNVYFLGNQNTISFSSNSGGSGVERLAFPTFLDWLMFYLEKII